MSTLLFSGEELAELTNWLGLLLSLNAFSLGVKDELEFWEFTLFCLSLASFPYPNIEGFLGGSGGGAGGAIEGAIEGAEEGRNASFKLDKFNRLLLLLLLLLLLFLLLVLAGFIGLEGFDKAC